jgi:hypothetical protein
MIIKNESGNFYSGNSPSSIREMEFFSSVRGNYVEWGVWYAECGVKNRHLFCKEF